MNSEAVDIVKSWFEKAEDWQKDLFINIWKGNKNEDSKNRTIKLIYKKHAINTSNLTPSVELPNDINSHDGNMTSTILKEIANVQGVGALEPTQSLSFQSGLNVVYGENGCGKSSYVRILKKAENPKCDCKIHSNVYKSNQNLPRATIVFEEDGIENSINWSITNQIICPIKIYDTQIARRFVEDANEVIYEPKILSAFTNMATVLEMISNKILNDIEESKGLVLPPTPEISDSEVIKEYLELKDERSIEKFKEQKKVTEIEEQELEEIIQNLKDNNLEETLKTLGTQVEYLKLIQKEIEDLIIYLDESKVIQYFNLKKDKNKTKEELDSFINSSKQISILESFGSEEWKNMWKATNEYSSQELNKEICLLCQQKLSKEAIDRMESFESIYKSNISQKYDEALEKYELEMKELEKIISEKLNLSIIQLNLNAKLLSDDINKSIINIYQGLYNRASWIYKEEEYDPEQNPSIQKIEDIEIKFEEFINRLNKRIDSIEKFLKDRNKQIEKKNNILAKKWLAQNSANYNIKNKIIKLEEAKSKCKTNSITTIKKDLSKIIITDTYIQKFREELEMLNPKHTIKVELVPNSRKGKTYHQIVLKCPVDNKKVEEILSEGEYRVVSIAAFLADLSSWDKTQAFIFDDPITSLDHKFEENVAKRIVKLAKERQVIVFTHRLAFAELLNYNMKEVLKKSNIEFSYIELRRDPLGEPMNRKLEKINFKKSINTIKDSLITLQKIFKSGDYDSYDLQKKGICSDIRNTLEKGIETTLLSGVVSRYERNISSLKLRYLKAIQQSDIEFFDRLMTKYSYNAHSFPTETPVELPEVGDIEKDIKEIENWIASFETRTKKFE